MNRDTLSNFDPKEAIQRVIDKIIVENGLKNVKDIKYEDGSQTGDGYMSATVAIDIIHDEGVLNLFLKHAQNIQSADEIYENEIYFYDVVLPAHQEFLREKQSQTIRYASKCYGTSKKGWIVALENLKPKGYTMYDRKTIMDRPHLELVFRTFAKFHAISFAFKDQRKEKHRRLIDGSRRDFYVEMMQSQVQRKAFTDAVENFLKSLDPINDKRTLEKCNNLPERLMESLSNPELSSTEYSILTQGDCWCNNMMFLYPERDSKDPEDVILIDWQFLREAPPPVDLSNFFYSIASEEALNDLDHYLRVYHRELSERLKELGSDPETVYPFRVLKEQWKQCGKYGFVAAFALIKIMLSEADELVNFQNFDFDDAEDAQKLYSKIRKEDEYKERLKMLAEHFVKNSFV